MHSCNNNTKERCLCDNKDLSNYISDRKVATADNWGGSLMESVNSQNKNLHS